MSGRPVRTWKLQLELPRAGDVLPTFLRIARAIADDARSGRLAPGSRLPSSRELAQSLGVHRNTVLAAYRELSAEGFIATEHGRGTFISSELPAVEPRRWPASTRAEPRNAARVGFAFTSAHEPAPLHAPDPRVLTLYGGVPDTRLLPRASIARALRRALAARSSVLGYGDPRGEPRLRDAIAHMLRSARGLDVSAEQLLITRGSQMALALIGRVLLRPGDVVAVEQLGYAPAWRAFQAAGATLQPIPVDADGLRVDVLATLCDRTPVRAVYVTPHHQYPTTVTMSAARRMALLELARKRGIAIIEDDYDHEFHYDGRPVLPLASADTAGVVLYVGTLSKVVAPALRAGYLVAPEPVLQAAIAARYELDRQGDRVTETALAELFEDGELQRHVWRARRVYHARRDHAVHALRESLGEWLDFGVPSGGMALWARVRSALPVARFHAEALRRDVLFQSGPQFHFDERPIQRLRLGYGVVNEAELATAVKRMREAAQCIATSRTPLRVRARPRPRA